MSSRRCAERAFTQSGVFPSVPGSFVQRANCSRRRSVFARYSATVCRAASGCRAQQASPSATAVAAETPSARLRVVRIVTLQSAKESDGRETAHRADIGDGLLASALPAFELLR